MIHTDLSDPAALRRERTAWPWRVAFLLFTLLLIIATHWPGPEVGDDQHTSPDKLMHFLSFGGFAFLLWMTGWFRRFWSILVIALCFTLLDEWSQSMFAANREASGVDIAAGILGVLTATAWITALEPASHPIARSRERRYGFVLEELLDLPSNWFILGIAFTLPLMVVAIGLYMVAWNIAGISIGNFSLAIGLICGCIVAGIMLRRLSSPIIERLPEERPCYECGEPLSKADIDEHGWGHCDTCGHQVHASQWSPLPLASIPMQVLFSTDGPVGMVCIILYMVLAIIIGPILLLSSGRPGLAGAIFFTGVGVIGAMAWKWRRMRMELVMKQLGQTCLRCGGDLSGTEDEEGIGTCLKCGTLFARCDLPLDDEQAAANTDSIANASPNA